MKQSIKKLFALVLAAGLVTGAQAKYVDATDAQTTGANFLIRKGVTGVASPADITLVYTASNQVPGNYVTDYYVYNINSTKGFVMVAADDNIIPILAYSNRSWFDINNMAPSTKDWIDGYKNEITAAINHNVPPKAGTADLWQELQTAESDGGRAGRVTRTTAVSPLLSTTWDQSGGGAVQYNQYCPNTPSTLGLSVTGCVATAMCQVMKFWNWPTVGTGFHTYYDTYSASAGSGSNTWNYADFGNTAYDFAAMPLTSSNKEVATLMYHAGVSVNMSYSSNESGSYVVMLESPVINCAEYALKTYFHYTQSLHGLLRFGLDGSSLSTYYEGQDYEYENGSVMIDSIPEAAWIDTLQTELNAGRPMLYMGQGGVGGHCWVCDGWETTDDMFDFNWGWSGMSDGYYTVDNLAPPALGVGGGGGNFNYQQGVVKGIFPDSFPNITGNIEMQSHLNYTNASSPIEYGTPFTLTAKVFNSGSSSFTGDFCAQVFDATNTQVATMTQVGGVTIGAGDSSALLTFNDSNATYNMIPVAYHTIQLFYRPTGTTTWTAVADNGNFINYTNMDVLNDTDIVLYDSLHVGSHILGTSISVTTTIANQSYSTAFGGTIEAALINTSTLDTFVIQSYPGVALYPGRNSTYTFTNSSISVPGGIYALIIMHQYGGTGNFYCTSSDFFTNPILLNSCPIPLPATWAIDPTACLGTTNLFSAVSPYASAYTWTVTGTGWSGSSSTNDSINITTGTGIATVSLTGSSACGVGPVTTFTIAAATTPPVPDLGPEVWPCVGSSTASYTASATYATTYNWSLTGSGWSMTPTTSNTLPMTVGTGTATLSCSAENACGTSTANIIVIAPMTPPDAVTSIFTPDPLCSGSTIYITTPGVPTATGYNWTVTGSGWSSSGTTDSSSVTVGTGPATVTVYPVNGCGPGTPYTITTGAPIIMPAASYVVENLVTNMAIEDIFTYTGGTKPGATYEWYFGVASIPDSASGTGPVSTLWATPGTKNITIAVSDSGCTITYVDTVHVINNEAVANVNAGNSGFRIIPNPSNGNFEINFNNAITTPFTVNIVDMNGRVVYANSVGVLNSRVYSVATDKLVPGNYNLNILLGNVVYTDKITILR